MIVPVSIYFQIRGSEEDLPNKIIAAQTAIQVKPRILLTQVKWHFVKIRMEKYLFPQVVLRDPRISRQLH